MMSVDAGSTQLLLIDWQQRLFGAMPEGVRDQALKSTDNLVFLAEALGMPVLRSEQYPTGLGPTLPNLAKGPVAEKMTFSAVEEPTFVEGLCRPQVLVAGMETHICVALTVAGLRARGLEVGVVADACLSRRKGDWERGLEFCRRAGAEIFSSETILFGMIGRAGTPLFKEISRRIR